jgi:hypothetical protein
MLELNSSPADHRRPACMRAMFTDVRPSIALGHAPSRHA